MAAKVAKATKLYQLGDLAGAKSQCQQALKYSNRLAPVIFLLGCIAKEEGHLEHAVSQFKKAITIDSKPFQFHMSLGDAYQQLGRLQPALAAMQKALETVDSVANEVMLFYNIGNLHRTLKQYTEALASFQKAMDLNPQMAEAHTSIGMVYRALGDLKQAEAYHRQAIQLNPLLKNAYNNLGIILLEANRNQEAIHSFEKIISLDSDYTEAYRNMGNAYIQLGKKQEALSVLNRYVDLNGPDISVSHMIDALSGKQTDTAPIEYIEKLFDGFADHFEERLADDLDYNIPTKIVKLLELTTPSAPAGNHTVLDLGCGTGVIGKLLAPTSKAIDGIDLSQAMLDKAQQKGVYRQLYKNEIIAFLQTAEISEPYDLIVAADVLVYIGVLEPLFNALKNSGFFTEKTNFIFSLESINTGSCQLLPSGRYAHSESYIEALCQNYGFNIVEKEQTMIRKDRGEAIDGFIFVIQLGALNEPQPFICR